ncbi:SDR family oxidoreductase [Sphingobium yanoikuyae]|uniref:SDR family oxidoreductase n=1 Tax=Sphingobium yanoikuyae TaxID=13690 RepID=UPI0022DD9781|nr:SDR family oxidoreductase [Sphingobium yanoikuyae]WBQ19406.1 SDR family oxidoreductase [Sphingobium yanoikuyae]
MLGASGFIGVPLLVRLKQEGYFVTGVVRDPNAVARLPLDRCIRLDLRTATSPENWFDALSGVDAVINCAGVLQDGARDSTSAVHVTAPAALYEACERLGIFRVIHFSALNADQDAVSEFSESKGQIERILGASKLDWVILRPSVVVGRNAYGGSALFRGLASLPISLRLPQAGRVSLVQLDDVTETVIRLLRPNSGGHIAIDLAGPRPLAFDEIVARYRAWLGWQPARLLPVSSMAMRVGSKLGDLAGYMGWRPPMRSTGMKEMSRGAEGEPAAWNRVTAIAPRSLERTLAADPASVQERWFARLYFLRPLAIVVFALFWVMTGVISLTIGWDIGLSYMQESGAAQLSEPSVLAGALADIAVGLAILYRPTTRLGLIGAVTITLFYLVAGTIVLPRLWADPLGPMIKIWPILCLNFMLLAILEER